MKNCIEIGKILLRSDFHNTFMSFKLKDEIVKLLMVQIRDGMETATRREGASLIVLRLHINPFLVQANMENIQTAGLGETSLNF